MKTIALLLLLASQSGLRSTTLCTGSDPRDCLPPPPICGNGIVHRIEACDDGNRTAGDGCSFMCGLEAGYACTGSPSSCGPDCGDSLLVGLETCDDGNKVAGDGCSDSCAVESGWYCTGLPSACVTTCGDGTKAGAEECDDGNLIDGDGCSASCANEIPPATQLVHLSLDESAKPWTNTGTVGGTFTGFNDATAGVAGKFGKAASTDSVGYIYKSDFNPFTADLKSFTVGGTFKQTATQPSWAKLIYQGTSNYAFQVVFDNTATGHWSTSLKFSGGDCSVGYAETTYNFTTGAWNDLRVVYNASIKQLSAYFNGTQVGTADCSALGSFVAQLSALRFGFSTNSQGFKGYHDELYFYEGIYTPSCGDGVITYGEACDDGNLVDGDGCSSTCAIETAPDANDVVALSFENNLVNSASTGGTLAANGTVGYAAGRVGNYGLSVASSATRNMVYGMPGTAYDVPGNAWTMSVWVKLSAYGTHYNKIFDRKYANDSSWSNPYVVQSIELAQSYNSGKWASSNAVNGSWYSCGSGATTIPLNRWTHLAVTYNGTQQKLYQNGVLVNTCNITGTTLMGNSGPIFLGGNLWDGSNFDQINGVIDDARIANVVRSDAYLAELGKIECGNGYLEGTEACDDGNQVNGDGCSSTCTVE